MRDPGCRVNAYECSHLTPVAAAPACSALSPPLFSPAFELGFFKPWKRGILKFMACSFPENRDSSHYSLSRVCVDGAAQVGHWYPAQLSQGAPPLSFWDGDPLPFFVGAQAHDINIARSAGQGQNNKIAFVLADVRNDTKYRRAPHYWRSRCGRRTLTRQHGQPDSQARGGRRGEGTGVIRCRAKPHRNRYAHRARKPHRTSTVENRSVCPFGKCVGRRYYIMCSERKRVAPPHTPCVAHTAGVGAERVCRMALATLVSFIATEFMWSAFCALFGATPTPRFFYSSLCHFWLETKPFWTPLAELTFSSCDAIL